MAPVVLAPVALAAPHPCEGQPARHRWVAAFERVERGAEGCRAADFRLMLRVLCPGAFVAVLF